MISVMIQVMNIITDHILALFIQYRSNPITNPIFQKITCKIILLFDILKLLKKFRIFPERHNEK